MQPTPFSAVPNFSADDAQDLLVRLYSIQAEVVAPLPSERDQNFAVTTEDGDHFVLKIANRAEDPSFLNCQNRAMMHIHTRLRPPVNAPVCPLVVPTPDGDYTALARDAEGDSYLVRLLSYVPGAPLAEVKPHSAHLLTSLGELLGRLDAALADFDHPATHHDLHWDLHQAGRVVEAHLHRLEPEQQSVIAPILAHFRQYTEPLLAQVRTGVIHGDANDYNVIVGPDGPWELMATGVIDFGDMVHSYVMGEVAIAAAYAMLGKRDPLAAATQVVAGYHSANPLTETELRVLYDLIRMRLAMSVCIAAWQSEHAPDNDYLSISQPAIWDLLARLEGVHPNLAHYAFRGACGLTPVPHEDQVMTWLESNRSKIHPIIDRDLANGDLRPLDLSVSSLQLPGDAAFSALGGLPSAFLGLVEAGNEGVSIGLFDEPRLVYSAPEFEVETDELPEQRTVHLGVDFFLPPDSPVYAPLDGVVHSLADNDAPKDYGPTIILAHETDEGVPFYTLYGHLSRASLARLTPGVDVTGGQLIGAVGDIFTNGGWPPHLHVQLILDMLDETGTFPGVAAPSWRDLWRGVSPSPAPLLGVDPQAIAYRRRSREDILEARRMRLGKSLSVAYRRPLKIVRGWRQFLYDEEGRAYLDAVNNVAHVGHSNPRVTMAGQEQMAVLNTNTRYLHDGIIDYAEALLETFPDPLSVVFFVCSGSEANELALRMARAYTERWDVIMLDGAYHGNTQALVDISPYKHNGPGGQGAPSWARAALMPDPYRGPYKGYGPTTGSLYATHVGRVIAELGAEGRQPAAFIAESVLGCGGQIVLPDGYLSAAYEQVRAVGGVCIADEVQVGFGRVGSHFWGFETQGVVPDIVTLGKPMGNGHPLAAVVTTPAIADAFANGMEYFNTFGGNPVSCAIGQAVLDEIREHNLQENAQHVGDHLLAGLRELMERHPLIGDVRGLGLFVGVELVLDRETLAPAPDHAAYVANRMRDHGVLISTDGPLHNVLKIKPPIIFTRADADRLVSVLDKVLGEDRVLVTG